MKNFLKKSFPNLGKLLAWSYQKTKTTNLEGLDSSILIAQMMLDGQWKLWMDHNLVGKISVVVELLSNSKLSNSDSGHLLNVYYT